MTIREYGDDVTKEELTYVMSFDHDRGLKRIDKTIVTDTGTPRPRDNVSQIRRPDMFIDSRRDGKLISIHQATEYDPPLWDFAAAGLLSYYEITHDATFETFFNEFDRMIVDGQGTASDVAGEGPLLGLRLLFDGGGVPTERVIWMDEQVNGMVVRQVLRHCDSVNDAGEEVWFPPVREANVSWSSVNGVMLPRDAVFVELTRNVHTVEPLGTNTVTMTIDWQDVSLPVPDELFDYKSLDVPKGSFTITDVRSCVPVTYSTRWSVLRRCCGNSRRT